MYKLHDAFKAHIKENVFATNSNIFDVKGEDEESQDNSNLHKWDIVKDLEKIDYKSKKAEEFLNNFNMAGEMIAFVGLNRKTIKRRNEKLVPIEKTVIDPLTGQEITEEVQELKLVVEDVETHSGVDVYPIKSEDFVYDTTKADRFDEPVCCKIIRKWLSYSEIINNNSFNLLQGEEEYAKETKEYIKNLIKGKDIDDEVLREDEYKYQTERQLVEGDQAEVLEYWGNILLKDGSEEIELNNYVITLAGSKVVRLEPNPYLNNMFVFFAREIHPDYKRGISPLRAGKQAADISSNITNELITALPLIASPSFFVPKGAIKNKQIKMKPGMGIEYDITMAGMKEPKNIDVSGILKGFDYLALFNSQIEEATGMYANMMGAGTAEKKTATEIQAMQVGGSIRISDLIDGIKQFNIKIIEKIADLKANFEFGEKQLGIRQEDGSVKTNNITDEVRNGKYNYTYIDSKATMEREARFKKVIDLLSLVLKTSANAINLNEVIKYALSETGLQDVERFLNKDILEEAIMQSVQSMGLEPNPENIEMAKQKLVEYLPEVTQGIIQNEQIKSLGGAIPQQPMGGMPPAF
jgi:hypothetical protein